MTSTAAPDQKVIDRYYERARGGDREALAELFWHFRRRLLTMVRLRLDRRVAARLDPADVLQETFIEVQERFPRYAADPPMPFFPWLHTLTGQRLLMIHRRHLGARMRDASLEVSIHGGGTSLAASSESLADHLAGSITSPSQAAMREERRLHFAAALDALPAIDREVLALRHLEDFTNDEVAAVLGLSKAAASNRYVRALKRLRAQLGDDPEVLP